jgi:membrane-associated phospholipid phosphatase
VAVGVAGRVGRLGGEAVAAGGHQVRRHGLILAGAAAAVVMALYAVAFGVPDARDLDATARADLMTLAASRQIETLDNLLDYLWVPALLVALLAVWNVLRGRRTLGLHALAVLVGTTAVALGLRWALYTLDPLGGQMHRPLEIMYFPSGHASVASAAALALVILAPGGRHRLALVVACGGIATVGVASVVEGSHYPSDVLAAYTLALGVAFLVDALVGAGAAEPPRPAMAAAVVAVAVAGAAALLAAGDGVSPRQILETGTHGAVAAVALAVLGACVPLAYLAGAAQSARSAALAAR